MGDRWTANHHPRPAKPGPDSRAAQWLAAPRRWWASTRHLRVEWQAKSIRDPRERLRYLRGAMGAGQPPAKPWRWRVLLAGAMLVTGMFLLPGWESGSVDAGGIDRRIPVAEAAASRSGPESGAEVWLVETREQHEMYSNGLRIETTHAVFNEPRRVIEMEEGGRKVLAGSAEPRGIVFHTTESHIAPFEASANQRLKKVARWLLDYVRDQRAYHFLIDRFGRVHRVVREQDAAWHAGHSVWADQDRAYIYLNHSFLGVAFESVTNPGGEIGAVVTPAQIASAKILTEMLRARYRIPAGNCVTHAQVSVNPANFLIGAHTDWAAGFPFAEVGLPDNYDRPLPALYAFGFGYDDDFVRATGARMWKGLALSEDQVRQEATARGIPVAGRRNQLRQHYRSVLARIDGAAPAFAGAPHGETGHGAAPQPSREENNTLADQVRE